MEPLTPFEREDAERLREFLAAGEKKKKATYPFAMTRKEVAFVKRMLKISERYISREIEHRRSSGQIYLENLFADIDSIKALTSRINEWERDNA